MIDKESMREIIRTTEFNNSKVCEVVLAILELLDENKVNGAELEGVLAHISNLRAYTK